MDYSITLNATPYLLSTADDAQIAAITACRIAYNNTLPDTEAAPRTEHENYRATDAAYLEFVFGNWAAANEGFSEVDLLDAFAGAAASYAGQDIPEPTPEELTPEETKTALKAYAADKRYRVEVGGTTIANVAMATDRDTQAKLTAAFLLAQVNPATTFEWKTPSGFVTLDTTAIAGIAVAIGGFVQAAFAAERVVSEAIDAETITDRAGVDAADWPS